MFFSWIDSEGNLRESWIEMYSFPDPKSIEHKGSLRRQLILKATKGFIEEKIRLEKYCQKEDIDRKLLEYGFNRRTRHDYKEDLKLFFVVTDKGWTTRKILKSEESIEEQEEEIRNLELAHENLRRIIIYRGFRIIG